MPRAEARGAHWVKPQLVAEIAFAEFTADNVVRHASFLGLRGDKKAKEVVAEKPQAGSPRPPRTTSRSATPSASIFPDAKVTKGELADYYRAVGALDGCPGPRTGRSAWSAARRGAPRNASSRSMTAGTFGAARPPRPDPREGRARWRIISTSRTAPGCSPACRWGRSSSTAGAPKVDDVEKPDRIVFDLDPDDGLDFELVKKAAQDLKRHLADMGLTTFPMLTGGKGVHVDRAADARRRNGRRSRISPSASPSRWPRPSPTASPPARPRRSATGPHLRRLSAQPARRDRDHALFRPRPRRRAGRGADQLGGAGRDESGARFSVRDAETLLERASVAAAPGLGRSEPGAAERLDGFRKSIVMPDLIRHPSAFWDPGPEEDATRDQVPG